MLYLEKKRRRSGFTLVEVMVVLMIITILVTICFPNYIHTREVSRGKTCMRNLSQMTTAKEQYAMENKKGAGEPVDWNDIVPEYIKKRPECPTDGDYTLMAVDEAVDCSIAGHEL